MIRRALCLGAAVSALAACVSVPAQYQPSIDNAELLLKIDRRLGVGEFTAAPGVQNHMLSARGVGIEGGAGGYAAFLREAVISELRKSGSYDPASPLQLSGVLTRNRLNSGYARGAASVGADLTLRRGEEVIHRNSIDQNHEWDSSLAGIVATSAAMDNYGATVQKLLGKLFSDPAFGAALAAAAPAH
jgi:hypothetical protein